MSEHPTSYYEWPKFDDDEVGKVAQSAQEQIASLQVEVARYKRFIEGIMEMIDDTESWLSAEEKLQYFKQSFKESFAEKEDKYD